MSTTTYQISEPQKTLILELLTERVIAPELAEKIRTGMHGFSWDRAKAGIAYLLSLPRVSAPAVEVKVTPAGEIVDVPAGRYAVETEAGVLAFYKVDRPTDGRWAGYTFVKVMASDEEHAIRGRAACDAILSKIQQAGVKAAAERYGQELGSCGICSRTLTDETSRRIGIGPVCRNKTGWYEA